jgi:hypothetical protein
MPSLITPIPIDLDRRRHVLLTNKAIFGAERELSKLWGKHCSLYEVLSETLGLNDMAIILWQGLLHESPTLNLEQVQDMIDFREIPALLTVILQAWNAATLPAEVAQDGVSPDSPFASPRPSPGSLSGASPASSLGATALSSGS